ncbi:hypothetical protein BGZ49_002153, partial [Haplosporangium sp. Z 27]
MVGVEDAEEEGEETRRDSTLPDLVIKHAESIPDCSRFLDLAIDEDGGGDGEYDFGEVPNVEAKCAAEFEEGDVERVCADLGEGAIGGNEELFPEYGLVTIDGGFIAMVFGVLEIGFAIIDDEFGPVNDSDSEEVGF